MFQKYESLGSAIVRVMVLLALAIFRLCCSFCKYAGARICDRTCIQAWTGILLLVVECLL